MSQAKNSIELTPKYATVSHKDDDTVPVGEEKSDAPAKALYQIPVPLDANGNPMSYEDASTAWTWWTMTFMVSTTETGCCVCNDVICISSQF